MPRPFRPANGKVSEFRADLESLRRRDKEGFESEVERVKRIYQTTGSIKATAGQLRIGKRTLERAMLDVPELSKAIDNARILMGR